MVQVFVTNSLSSDSIISLSSGRAGKVLQARTPREWTVVVSSLEEYSSDIVFVRRTSFSSVETEWVGG